MQSPAAIPRQPAPWNILLAIAAAAAVLQFVAARYELNLLATMTAFGCGGASGYVLKCRGYMLSGPDAKAGWKVYFPALVGQSVLSIMATQIGLG